MMSEKGSGLELRDVISGALLCGLDCIGQERSPLTLIRTTLRIQE